jgi:hypothetical protein
MSLESIYRVLSHAHKAASEVNSGTADEKGALDVLGGLTALLESRIQLHKHAAPATVNPPAAAPPAGAAAKPRPTADPATARPVPAPAPDDRKQRTPSQSGDSYDLR